MEAALLAKSTHSLEVQCLHPSGLGFEVFDIFLCCLDISTPWCPVLFLGNLILS